MIYLAISLGNVPVESLFRVTGLILNCRRSYGTVYKLNIMVTFVHDNINLCGAVALLLAGRTSDQRITSSNPALDNCYRVITLGKLFTPMCLCHQAV